MTDPRHNPTGAGDGTPEGREQPIIRDKRRIDPETGKLREPQHGTGPAESAGSGEPGESPDSAAFAGTPGFADTPDSPDAAPDAADQAAGNLADLKAENARLADELARANASYFNLNQEYSNYVRRSKEQAATFVDEGREKVLTALFGVLDDIELARQHNELTGPLGSMAEKFENTLTTNFKLERYGAPGEEFDPLIHEALMDNTSDEVEVPTIAAVIQPGYRMGEKVLRPARVAVNSPA